MSVRGSEKPGEGDAAERRGAVDLLEERVAELLSRYRAALRENEKLQKRLHACEARLAAFEQREAAWNAQRKEGVRQLDEVIQGLDHLEAALDKRINGGAEG